MNFFQRAYLDWGDYCEQIDEIERVHSLLNERRKARAVGQ